jgi:hypothetical protein
MIKRNVTIGNVLEGDLSIPQGVQAVILFAHGSGSDRHSARNGYVAQALNDRGFATLLVDLLTPQEKEKGWQAMDRIFQSSKGRSIQAGRRRRRRQADEWQTAAAPEIHTAALRPDLRI